VLLGVVVMVMLAFAVDAGVGRYQSYLVKQQRQARLQLENTAMRSLYVEDSSSVPADPNRFPLTIRHLLQNPAHGRVILFEEADTVCGYAVNKSNTVGIGILYNAYSNYPYDAIIYPGQSSRIYAAAIDKVYAGTNWCIDGYDARYTPFPVFTVKGPGWSGNLTDWLSPIRVYARWCGGGSW
jgi:hypothetical protein